MAVTEERLELLERQQAMTIEALKLVLQGRWKGDLPTAEAMLKAINPSDTDWEPVPFDEGTE